MSDEEGKLPPIRIETWDQAVPPAAVPVPARHAAELHRARAIASVPGTGILHDMRVLGEPTHEDGDLRVDLVPELDYWRTRILGQHPAPLRLPLDQVWIEHRLPFDPDESREPRPGEGAGLMRRLAPGPEQPGARIPVPARTVPHLHGRRIIQTTPLGFCWDLRAISEPYDDGDAITLRLTSAHHYYRWLLTRADPETTPVPLYVLWTE
ncbi:hypothetical protein [Streptomyces sp. 891-h]|uniref:hypothetical protein n=1 Tax=Streptomyces sp. 891-h TaxID=2720714 RepID=UPI001FA9CD98|nr:hypothetical protein [Streptomyces sp. 891-h]UNZ22311.1 hypothetical protein HC362_34665 [Streptomyces sp. 891-h]